MLLLSNGCTIITKITFKLNFIIVYILANKFNIILVSYTVALLFLIKKLNNLLLSFTFI